MKLLCANFVRSALISVLALLSIMAVDAQQKNVSVLAGTELTRVVPTSFYFEGQARRRKCVMQRRLA